ncbi:MAG: transposase [Candidatus Rokuibacteriota bacterium]
MPADHVVEESPALALISSASIQGRIAFGPRAGARVWRVGDDPDAPWVLSTAPRHAHLAGFDLHANVEVPAADRPRLEQLCRYLLRPAVARHRLRRRDDGRIGLTLKTAWADGTRQLMFEPLTRLERLAALTPRPRINLVLYHGVLAPHAGWRARVITYGRPRVDAPAGASAAANRTDDGGVAPVPRHWAGAELETGLRHRRAGVPGLRRAPALDGHGRGPGRDSRDSGRRRGVARTGGARAAFPRVAGPRPGPGNQRLSTIPAPQMPKPVRSGPE